MCCHGDFAKAISQYTKYQGDNIWYEVFTYYGRISGKIGKVSRFYAAGDYCQDGVALFELSIILVACSKPWKSMDFSI